MCSLLLLKVPLCFYVIFLIARITFLVFIPCTFYPRNFIFEMFRVFFLLLELFFFKKCDFFFDARILLGIFHGLYYLKIESIFKIYFQNVSEIE